MSDNHDLPPMVDGMTKTELEFRVAEADKELAFLEQKYARKAEKTTATPTLNKAEIDTARKLGISPEDYLKAKNHG